MMSLHVSDISVMRKQADWLLQAVNPAAMSDGRAGERKRLCAFSALQIAHGGGGGVKQKI